MQILHDPIHLAYSEYGSRTPMLMVHGFPLSKDIWASQVGVLSKHCRVIMPDLRGHGQSQVPPGAYTIEVMARDLLYLLDNLWIEKAIWVGHSMGGYILLAAWRMAPERFLGMGLVATHPRADGPDARQRRYELAEAVAREGSEVAVNPNLFSDATPAHAPRRLDTEQVMRDTKPDGIIGALHAMANRSDSLDILGRINVPAVIIAGDQDRIIPMPLTEAMADMMPTAELYVVRDSGHMPMLENVKLTNVALLSLVQRVKKGQ